MDTKEGETVKKIRLRLLSILAIGLMSLPALAGVPQRAVPSGTRLLLRLDTALSSKASRVGDRFSATIVSPARFAGGKVEGHIARIEESGRIKGRTEMRLDFDRIEFRDGGSAPLNAELMEIRQSESVKTVDEEGNIQTGSRGKQSIKRGAIGAAIGGVLGGLIGGGKGAVVGILLGGGAGAGSLAIDGGKELRLDSGAELEIRTTRAAGVNSAGDPTYTRSFIRNVQRTLNEKGYDAGPADGVMGRRTRDAISQFQRDNNLSVTGRVDRETAEKLGVR